jgi:hypothetical protein
MKRGLYFFIFSTFFPLLLRAQVIDNLASYRNINSNKFLRLYYDNDFFAATDEYYTQGSSLELVLPVIQKFPTSKILLTLPASDKKYGISIEHIGYTSTSIHNPDIAYGDRPFAAYAFLKSFVIATDPVHHRRLSSALSAGILGPYALGENVQRSIHRWLGDKEPLGWRNQIQTDVILNYEASYEKSIYASRNLFEISGGAAIRAGTLNDKATAMITFMVGKLNPEYLAPTGKESLTKRNLVLYLYSQPQCHLVGYDATLQGGLFTNSAYTLSSSDLSRLTFQNNFGVVFSVKKIYLEYFQSVLTKEFESGRFHSWGGLRIGLNL